MPDYGCYCGTGFSLPQKKCSSLLSDCEQFCCVDCFLAYILSMTKSSNGLRHKTKSPFVSEAFDVWDSVTERYYRSWFEVYVARCLFYNHIPFEYETRCLFLNHGHYTPDFWLLPYSKFIEVKGFWGFSAKRKVKEALSKGEDIILLPWHLFYNFKKKFSLKSDALSTVR